MIKKKQYRTQYYDLDLFSRTDFNRLVKVDSRSLTLELVPLARQVPMLAPPSESVCLCPFWGEEDACGLVGIRVVGACKLEGLDSLSALVVAAASSESSSSSISSIRTAQRVHTRYRVYFPIPPLGLGISHLLSAYIQPS
jgi:hypothetical protein